MKFSAVFAALAALGLSACVTPQSEQQAFAAPDSTAVAASASDDGVDMSEVVCRKEQTTGTRFARKVCMTRQQWEDAAKNVEGGDIISNAQRRGLQYSPPGG